MGTLSKSTQPPRGLAEENEGTEQRVNTRAEACSPECARPRAQQVWTSRCEGGSGGFACDQACRTRGRVHSGYGATGLTSLDTSTRTRPASRDALDHALTSMTATETRPTASPTQSPTTPNPRPKQKINPSTKPIG